MPGVRVGDVIAEKYRIEKLLGQGGTGFVFAALHLQLGQTVALKFLRDDVNTPEHRSRFLREARNTVRLKSHHVSKVLDVAELENGVPYMVLEYLEGVDLSFLLRERGALPAAEACEYVLQACEAIAEAHAHGIIHRDLKPSNLFLTAGQGGEPIVKVLDFGVSKLLMVDNDLSADTQNSSRLSFSESIVTQATDWLGSPGYMSPEQIECARDADRGSDLWSLGVILFRLMSGHSPFQGQSLGELIQSITRGLIPRLHEAYPDQDIPEGLSLVVARCLERDREIRLKDVSELARELAPYAESFVAPSLERIEVLGATLATYPSRPPSQVAALEPAARALLVPSALDVAPAKKSVRWRKWLVISAVCITALALTLFGLAYRRRNQALEAARARDSEAEAALSSAPVSFELDDVDPGHDPNAGEASTAAKPVAPHRGQPRPRATPAAPRATTGGKPAAPSHRDIPATRE